MSVCNVTEANNMGPQKWVAPTMPTSTAEWTTQGKHMSNRQTGPNVVWWALYCSQLRTVEARGAASAVREMETLRLLLLELKKTKNSSHWVGDLAVQTVTPEFIYPFGVLMPGAHQHTDSL